MDKTQVNDMFTLLFCNDSLNQGRRWQDSCNAAAITAINVHGRCGQALDARISVFDVEDATAQTRVDPISQSYHLNSGISHNAAVRFDSSVALEAIKLAQKAVA